MLYTTKTPAQKREFTRRLFSTAHDATPDEQGRILIPQHLKDFAGLKRNVVVLGVGSRAEIWDKATLKKREKASDKDFERVISSLDL